MLNLVSVLYSYHCYYKLIDALFDATYFLVRNRMYERGFEQSLLQGVDKPVFHDHLNVYFSSFLQVVKK